MKPKYKVGDLLYHKPDKVYGLIYKITEEDYYVLWSDSEKDERDIETFNISNYLIVYET